MRLATFNELLQAVYPEAEGKYYLQSGMKQDKFGITYNPNGKVYYYRGTIISIAAKLEIVPEIDVTKEAEKISNLLVDSPLGTKIQSYPRISDTLRYYVNQAGITSRVEDNDMSDTSNTPKDDYGRRVCDFWLSNDRSDGWNW